VEESLAREGLKNTAFAFFSDFLTCFLVGGRVVFNRLQVKNVNPFPQAPNPLYFSDIP
jgi:hypothetical protein